MIYLDTNVFVYLVEYHPAYGPSCKQILQDIEDRKIEATSSTVSILEMINVFQKMNKNLQKQNNPVIDISKAIGIILNYPINWVDLTISVVQKASEYSNRLRASDRTHLASMELHKIIEIISADKDFDNIPGIKRIDPLKYKRK